MNLNVERWKYFLLKDICHISMGNKMDAMAMTTDNPRYNFVGRSAVDNGVAMKVDAVYTVDGKLIEPYPAGCITIALGGSLGSTYLQDEPFYTSQNVSVLQFPDNVSTDAKLFLCTLIHNESLYKYFPFGRELNTHIRTDFGFTLPVDQNGNPDWQFMEDYIKSLHYKPLTTKNKKGQVHDLDVRDWGEFRVGDLFVIERGQRLIADDREEGNIAYFSASQDNNGCTDHISNPLFIRRDSLIYDTFGDCYYVSGEFTASDEISILSHDRLNPYNGLFIATIMMANKYKYAFGRKAFQNKFVDNCIKLPVDTDANPDWQFMEDYIKALPYGDRLEI